MAEPDPEITELLNLATRGDPEAARRVFPRIYGELRRLASARLAGTPPGGTLQTTALVHEAYVRIVGRHPEGWEGMRHFYFTAARAMRDILVEHARRKSSRKRGGGQDRVPLDDLTITLESAPDDVLLLDRALTRLESEDPTGHQLVLLRFFAGVSMPDAARIMDLPLRTLERKWRFLRVWLLRQLESGTE